MIKGALREPGARVMAQAAQRQRLPCLEHLTLQTCQFDAPAFEQLAQADWGKLMSLDVTGNKPRSADNSYSDAACASAIGALATSLGPALQELRLVSCEVSAAVVTVLVQHQRQLSGLCDLDILLNHSLSSDSIVAVASAGWALKCLAINATSDLTGEAAAALAALSSLTSLVLFLRDPCNAPLATVQWNLSKSSCL